MDNIERLEKDMDVLQKKMEASLLEMHIAKSKCLALDDIVRECCGSKIIEQRTLAHRDLKDVIDELKSMNDLLLAREKISNDRFDSYEKRLSLHEKYFYIVIGVAITLEFVGIGEKIRSFLQ